VCVAIPSRVDRRTDGWGVDRETREGTVGRHLGGRSRFIIIAVEYGARLLVTNTL